SASYRGRVAADTGQLVSALDLHHTAFRHFLTVADLTSVGNELTRMGLILCRLDQRREALESFQQALNVYQEAGNRRGALIVLLTMAGAAYELRLHDVAEQHAEAAQSLAQQLDDHTRWLGADYILTHALQNL